MQTWIACLALLLTVSLHTPALAQSKIGYTNIELVLAYMPEAKNVEVRLAAEQRKLGQQLQAKQGYAKGKLDEYMRLKEQNLLTDDAAATREQELRQLDDDITKFAEQSEQQLLQKRQELLVPVLDKLQASIDSLAREQGYTIILNQTTSSGVSTILFGPEDADVTQDLMKKLGITVPGGG